MPTYRNDPPGWSDEPPPRTPGGALPDPPPRLTPTPPPTYPPDYPPAGRSGPDNRPLLIAAVVALVALVAVVGYYLLVYVPARDAREARDRDLGVSVQTERPPGALDDGDGFRPSVIEAEPLDPGEPRLDDAPPSNPSDGSDPEGGDEEVPGLEQPPRRAPQPATPEAERPPAPPPAPRPAPSAPATSARPEHVDFAEEYLDRQAGDAVSYALGLYATSVRYYDRGRISADAVGSDKEAYFRRFPDRRYTLASPVRVVSSAPSGAATLRFDYTYALGGAGRERSGRAWIELDVVPSGGTFLIQGERGDVY